MGLNGNAVHGVDSTVCRLVVESQLLGFIFFLGLLSSKRDLRRHHPLSFRDQRALRADTIPPSAVPLMSLERRHDPVVATPGAFGRAGVRLLRSEKQA